MIKNICLRGAIVSACFVLLCSGCEDLSQIGEIDEVALEAEFAIPIIQTELSIADLFDEDESTNSFLDIDANGDMTIFFDTEGPSTTFEDVAELPSLIPLQATANGFKVNLTSNTSFQPTEIALNDGAFNFQVSSSMNEDVDVTIQIPELMLDGQMFSTSIELEHDPAQAIMTKTVGPIDLTDYDIMLDENYEFTVMYIAMSENGQTSLDAAIGSIENASYDHIKGVWADENIILPASDIPLDIYRNWESGTLTFADPQIRVDLTSNIGFPTGFQFDAITGTTVDNNAINMTGSALGATNSLNYPGLESIGSRETTSVFINSSNSNIGDFFTSQLENIAMQMSANTNTGDVNAEGFITDAPLLTSHIFAELPVFGTATDFTLSERFNADLGEVENIKEAEITVSIDNGLPIDLAFTLNFINANGEVFDELFSSDPLVISAASVDGSGNVESATASEITISIDALRANTLFSDTHEIEVRSVLSTADGGLTPVRINANQSMDISLSALLTIQD